MSNVTDADKILRNDTGLDIVDKLDDILTAIQSGGGSSTLSGLEDVNVTSPSNGQVLKYDNVSGKWIISHENPISLNEEKQNELKVLLKKIQGYDDYMFKNALNYVGWLGWHEGYLKE